MGVSKKTPFPPSIMQSCLPGIICWGPNKMRSFLETVEGQQHGFNNTVAQVVVIAPAAQHRGKRWGTEEYRGNREEPFE